MLVPVLSRSLQIKIVCDNLREHGLVIIETTRTHADNLEKEILKTLGICEGEEDEPKLIHLSTEVPDQGWSDFFIYTSVYNYIPNQTEKIVVKAVLSWGAANSPDNYFAHV